MLVIGDLRCSPPVPDKAVPLNMNELGSTVVHVTTADRKSTQISIIADGETKVRWVNRSLRSPDVSY